MLIGYLNDFCSVYIDDILIFLESEAEYEIYVKRVLKRLQAAGLQADIDKCEFHTIRTKFLGFIVRTKDLKVDPEKVAIVNNWQLLISVKGVQFFLGFCNFYRKFVRDYSGIIKPLTNLI
jgi:hypothetical protein